MAPRSTRTCFRYLTSSVALAALLGLSVVLPGHAMATSLTEALGSAYLNNPTLQAQRAELRATDENVPQALSGWRPTIQATGSAGIEHIDQESQTSTIAGFTGAGRTTSNLSQTRRPQTIGIDVTQPIYRGGRTTAAVDQAENNVLAARSLLLQTQQNVLLNAGISYMNVLRDKAVVDLTANNIHVLDRQLEATRDRFSVGEVTRTDTSQAEARAASAIADRRQAEGDLESSRANYISLIGDEPLALAQPTPIPGLPTTKAEAIAAASRGNPAVLQAVFTHRAAVNNVRQIEGELLPTLSVNGSAQHGRETFADESRQTAYSVTANLSVPLYQAGSVRARVRQAKQLASQRLIQVEEARRQAIQDAAGSWETLVAQRARITSLETQISAQNVALEGVQQEALVGTRTVLDVLDAEQELLDARVNLVRARRDEVVASLNLAAAVGSLTVYALDLPVPRYDMDAYYQAVRDAWFGLDIPSER